ncbi:maltokinase N-terminal cap-like domain-containing protein [Labedaea rhizosphaerae]|uniref:Maltokinase N-terminal cap domain-containing protein n=1 Tax=Labedaea rhizosphaerae TaxID=598644 RepID=A0A4R6SMQ0_LABRH|nr:hypothetical protein [Labedaea rhizosphaerae]TDQ05214.1 hypothetical protein EV186_1011182 [Labedaea rhizosphaerae]
MAKIHPGATLTPHFRDFLPPWIARQPWYPGTQIPTISAVGFLRLEDPAGEVGMEIHLVTDGSRVLQLPLTYRGAPLDGGALVATAEHSVLGTRWIYDAETDPVWTTELLRLVRANDVFDESRMRGATEARGHRIHDFADAEVRIEVVRVLNSVEPIDDPSVVGVVEATWPDGSGRLAVVRRLAQP